jgi:hypothetical protein
MGGVGEVGYSVLLEVGLEGLKGRGDGEVGGKGHLGGVEYCNVLPRGIRWWKGGFAEEMWVYMWLGGGGDKFRVIGKAVILGG